MELYLADAFTQVRFGGNPAGVVLLARGEDFPPAEEMGRIAAELRHSETAFVQPADGGFRIRYFTPSGEVPLCGHATIAAFTLLREEGILSPGSFRADTGAGLLPVRVTKDAVWMDMAPSRLLSVLTPEDGAAAYAAFGLMPGDRPEGFRPAIVRTGLADILLPVSSIRALEEAVLNRPAVLALSAAHDVVGVHLYCPLFSRGVTARCRNFAPRCAIDEESATGTSCGSLTYDLSLLGKIFPGRENVFLQGQEMGRPSVIRSRLELRAGNQPAVLIGGAAVPILRGRLL